MGEKERKIKAVRSHSESCFEFLIGLVLASSRSLSLPKSFFFLSIVFFVRGRERTPSRIPGHDRDGASCLETLETCETLHLGAIIIIIIC